MRTVDILGENRFETFTKTRTGSRGIVTDGDCILLSREDTDVEWMIPGGGTEGNETPEMCCQREVQEETGYIVRPGNCFLQMNEYYEEYKYTTWYFKCAVTGRAAQRLTEAEKKRSVRPHWLPIQEALAVFARHAEYAETNEEKRGIYLREYTALTCWLEQKKK